MALIERIDGALSDGRVEDRRGRPKAGGGTNGNDFGAPQA
jgi:hypothetical protein